MPSKIVLHEGRLSRVVETYQDVEQAQLDAEVESKQNTVNQLQGQVDGLNVQLEDAKVALEEAKSEQADGTRLVAESADTATGEQTDESGENVVHVPVENF